MKNKYFTFCLLFVGVLLSSPVLAQSRWDDNKHSEVRVIYSPMLSQSYENAQLIGLHVKMRKGWKTYWRKPGESGIPPQFDWRNSQNLKRATVLYPAPARLVDPYGYAIGYKTEVVFPVLVEPLDASKPVELRLHFAFGVCDEICVPAEKNISARVPGRSSTNIREHRLLAQYLEQVPAKKQPGADNSSQSPVLGPVKMSLRGKKPYLELNITYPEASKKNDLFVEVSEGFFMADPKIVRRSKSASSEVITYNIDLSKGDPVAELKGKSVKLTMVSGKKAAETEWQIK